MDLKELLFAFESKYPFLYDIQVNGVPVYTCYRDGVLARLQDLQEGKVLPAVQGRAFPKRILHSFIKFSRFRKKQTLIFTSSMYRRDAGRNLAAEYLLGKYPDGVIFEWPSRTEAYDSAYFADPLKGKYCPMEWYLICYKVYAKLARKKIRKWEEECAAQLKGYFENTQQETQEEKQAVAYLLEELPKSCATTTCAHQVFRWLFKKYKNIQYVVDFWGGAWENIIPVLPGKPESIELQHGIITTYHPGYMYPDFVKNCNTDFFKRTLLVYGEKTKTQLVEDSIFKPEQIQVIGNPRIKMYKKCFTPRETERKLLLFASQPYEQDGVATGYYDTVIGYLEKVQDMLTHDPDWAGYRLGIKLHPRENNGVAELYEKALPGVKVYDNASQLYTLLAESFVQLTVSSTSLYEAAEFDTPTIITCFKDQDPERIFGFLPRADRDGQALCNELNRLLDGDERNAYIQELKENTKQYM